MGRTRAETVGTSHSSPGRFSRLVNGPSAVLVCVRHEVHSGTGTATDSTSQHHLNSVKRANAQSTHTPPPSPHTPYVCCCWLCLTACLPLASLSAGLTSSSPITLPLCSYPYPPLPPTCSALPRTRQGCHLRAAECPFAPEPTRNKGINTFIRYGTYIRSKGTYQLFA